MEHIDASDSNQRKPFVRVTLQGPDDGGDFGPNTPGTRTSGIQEALNYAHASCRDVYIYGGRGGLNESVIYTDNVYRLEETLHIPWNQDFRLDGGNYVLSYTRKSGDAVIIDSQMSCRYKFGLIVSKSDGAAVRIKPHTIGPDDFTVIETSVFEFPAIVSYNPEGAGIVLDSSQGPILHSRIIAEETNTEGRGVYLTGSNVARAISQNAISVGFNQQCHASGNCTNLQIGDPDCVNVTDNRFEMFLHAPLGVFFDQEGNRWNTPEDFDPPKEAVGARIFGQSNLLHLSFYGKRAPGKDLVFEESARDNTVYVFKFPNGMTNRAKVPTNRIIQNLPPAFNLTSPPIPQSGSGLVNDTCYSVDIMILSPGQVSEWSIMDVHGNQQAFSSGVVTGQTICLDPGEQISLVYTKTPTWCWKASR
ncbi:MAG: hypothetical protein PVG14_01075 [Anaerolineales bacterium]